MDVRVLGTLAVVDDTNATLALGGQKQRGVLAMLAVEPNTMVSVDRLAEGVWGESVPDRYVQNLQVYVSTLRRVLEPNRTTTMPSRIVSHRAGYELVVSDDELDLGRFRSLAKAGSGALDAEQPATAAEALRAALREWHGDPCGDLIDLPFFAAMTRELHDEWWVVFEQCIRAELANGRASELIPELDQAVERAPTRERTWEHLVLALYRAGRQADALHAYQRARKVLAEELGIDPGPGLQQLERDVLQQSPTLDAPRRASMRTARVPVPLSSLVGRASLVSDIEQRFESHRLVVLTGHGGIGKTRAALALATRAQDAGRTVYFADLTAERDPSRVVAALARSAGLPDTADARDVGDTVEQAGALLVVDNFEQVVDAADAIATITSLAPSGRVLVTSRIRLGIPGEHVVDIPPLSTDADDGPATQLFWDRALEVDPRLQPSEHAAAALAVCRALDGMPLAIELAASRVSTFKPAELADRVTAAVETVVDVGTDRHRHGSLRAAMRWSTDLLSAEELTLFGVLSVCEAPVDLATVLNIAQSSDMTARAAERALDGLVRASLVRTSETPAGRRYGYLATTRAVARERLSAPVEHDARLTHAMWFARRAWDQVYSADDTWLATAIADLPDSTAAMRWLTAHDEPARATELLGGLFTVALVNTEGFRYVHSLATELLATAALPSAMAARARVVAGGMAYAESDNEEAERLLASASELDDHDYFFRFRADFWRALIAAERGAHDDAQVLADSARRVAALAGAVRLIGLGWSACEYVARFAGDASRALACAEQRLLVEPAGSMGEANATIEIAQALLELSRVDEATEQAMLALVRAQRLGLSQLRGDAYRCMAWCSLIRGDPRTAAAYLVQQLAIFDHHDGAPDRVVETTLTTAIACGLAGELDEARHLWTSGTHLLAHLGLTMQELELPRNVLALADELHLDSGQAIGDYLDDVLPTVVATLHNLCAGEPELASEH